MLTQLIFFFYGFSKLFLPQGEYSSQISRNGSIVSDSTDWYRVAVSRSVGISNVTSNNVNTNVKSNNLNEKFPLFKQFFPSLCKKASLGYIYPMDTQGECWSQTSQSGSYISDGTDWKRVAVGCAVTSVGITDLTSSNFQEKFPLFQQLLPSFCKTVSPGYIYPIYLAFDQTDPVFNNIKWLQLFHETFNKIVAKLKCNDTFTVSLKLVQCSHERRPAWAQNDAMMEAYIDGANFFYRVNDDTVFQTSGWTEKFIQALAKFQPPFIGVVGPNHTGGKIAILTYDFVHRNHIDMFGFYYPRTFTGWFSDSWITDTYKKAGKMEKLSSVNLQHKVTHQRYPGHFEKRKLLKGEVNKGVKTLNRLVSGVVADGNDDGRRRLRG